MIIFFLYFDYKNNNYVALKIKNTIIIFNKQLL